MMTFDELVAELVRAYREAPHNEINARIILFGIKYADDLRHVNVSDIEEAVSELTERNSYAPEISNGVKLAKYVELK
ncbi:MAG: hypothetical protein OXI33_01655 [Chloroflexota bacterium]|nr:hypothetical protein [Chloroflexota bacterium]